MKVPFVSILIISVISAKWIGYPKKYYVFKVAKLNWYGAFVDCLSRGLQLATVNSAAEQFALEQTMKEYRVEKEWLWISGTDLPEQGSFVWMSTGKPVTFSKWRAGQPDNAGGVEHCIHIWNTPEVLGNWNDWQCLKKIFYICEDRYDGYGGNGGYSGYLDIPFYNNTNIDLKDDILKTV